jgi:YcaO-like protein with predicted kinase domain
MSVHLQPDCAVDNTTAPFPPNAPAPLADRAARSLADVRRIASSCAYALARRCAEVVGYPLAVSRENPSPASSELTALFRLVMSARVDPDAAGAQTLAWMRELQRRVEGVSRHLEARRDRARHALLSGYADVLLRNLAECMRDPGSSRVCALVADAHPTALLQHAEPRVAIAHPLYVLAQWQNDCYGGPLWPALLDGAPRLVPADRRLLHVFALFLALCRLLQQPSCETEESDLTPTGIDGVTLCAWHVQMLDQNRSHVVAETLVDSLSATAGWLAKRRDGFGERSESLEDTLARIEPVMHLAGITRVPDITGLDNTGVPAFQCIRPDAQGGDQTFTVFGGKGESPLQCRVSAIAEGIERFCAEDNTHRDRIVSASYRELSARHAVVHPRRFNMPESLGFADDEPLEWLEARRLDDGAACYVPACTVSYPYEPKIGRMLTRFFTTGLAAGNDKLEAISHGLAEVIERDAAALNRIVRRFPAVDPATIDSPRAQDLIRRFRDANLNVFIRAISAPDIGIPVFSVILEDQINPDPLFVSGGYGAHPDKEVALVNALTEASLSRSGTISGAREDLEKFRSARDGVSYEEFRRRYRYWFATDPAIDYTGLPTYRMPTVADDLCLMANHVHAAGLRDLLWVDLSRPELELSVVKVLVPGIERYSFKMTCIGQRARDLYQKEHGRPLQA